MGRVRRSHPEEPTHAAQKVTSRAAYSPKTGYWDTTDGLEGSFSTVESVAEVFGSAAQLEPRPAI